MAEQYKGFEDTKMRRYQVDPIAPQPLAIPPQAQKYRSELDSLYNMPDNPYGAWKLKRNSLRREIKSTMPDISDDDLEYLFDAYGLGQADNPGDFSREKGFGGTVSRWGQMVKNLGGQMVDVSEFAIAKGLDDPEGMLDNLEQMDESRWENSLIYAYQSKDMNPVTQFLFDLSVSVPTMAAVMVGGVAGAVVGAKTAAAIGITGAAAWLTAFMARNTVEALAEVGFNYVDIITDPMVREKLETAMKKKLTTEDEEAIRLEAVKILSERADDSAWKVFLGNLFNPLNRTPAGAGRFAKMIKTASGKWGTIMRTGAKSSGIEALEEALQSAGSQYTAMEAKMLALGDVGEQIPYPLLAGTIYGIDPKQVGYEALMGGVMGGPFGSVSGYRGYKAWEKGSFSLDKNGNPIARPSGTAKPGDEDFVPKGVILNQVRSAIDIPDTETALVELDRLRQKAVDQDDRIVRVIDEEIADMRRGADLLGEKTEPKRTSERKRRVDSFKPGTHFIPDATPIQEAADPAVELNEDAVLRQTVDNILQTPEEQRSPRDIAYLQTAQGNVNLDNKGVNAVIANMEKAGTIPRADAVRAEKAPAEEVGEPVVTPEPDATPVSTKAGDLPPVLPPKEGEAVEQVGTEREASVVAEKGTEPKKKPTVKKEAVETIYEETPIPETLTVGESATEIVELVKSWALREGFQEGGWDWNYQRGKLYNKIKERAEEEGIKPTEYTTKKGKKKNEYQIPADLRDRIAEDLALELEIEVPGDALPFSRARAASDIEVLGDAEAKEQAELRSSIEEGLGELNQTKEQISRERQELEEELAAEVAASPKFTKGVRLYNRDGSTIKSPKKVPEEDITPLIGQTVIHYSKNRGFRNDDPNSFPKRVQKWRFDGVDRDGNIFFSTEKRGAGKLGQTVKKELIETHRYNQLTPEERRNYRPDSTVRRHAISKNGKHTREAEAMLQHLLSGLADTYSVKEKGGKYRNGFITEGREADTPLRVAEGTEKPRTPRTRPVTQADVEEQVHTDALTEGMVDNRKKSADLKSPEQVTDKGLADDAAKKRTKQQDMKDKLAARRGKKGKEKIKDRIDAAEEARALIQTVDVGDVPLSELEDVVSRVAKGVGVKVEKTDKPMDVLEKIRAKVAPKKETKAPVRPPKGEMATVGDALEQGTGAIGKALEILQERVNQAKKTGRVLDADAVKNSLPEKFREDWYAKIEDDPKYTDVSRWDATGKTTEFFSEQIKKDLGGVKKAPTDLKELIRNALVTWLEGEVTPDNSQSLKDRYFPLLTQKQREKVNFALAKKGGSTVSTKVDKYSAKEKEASEKLKATRKPKKTLKKKSEVREEKQETKKEAEPTNPEDLVSKLTRGAVKATKKVPYKEPKTPDVWQIVTSEVERIFAPYLSDAKQNEIETFIDSLGGDDSFIVSKGLAKGDDWKIYRLNMDIDVAEPDSVARYESGSSLLAALDPEPQVVPDFIKRTLHQHGVMLGKDRKANKFISRKLDRTDLIETTKDSPSLPSDILARIDRDVDVDLNKLADEVDAITMQEDIAGTPIVWAFNTGNLVELSYMYERGKGEEPTVVNIEFKDEATASTYVETVKSLNPDRERLQQDEDELVQQMTKENINRSAHGEAQIETLTALVQKNAEDHGTVYDDFVTDTDVGTSTDYYNEVEAAKDKERKYTPEEIAEYESKLKDQISDGRAIPIILPTPVDSSIRADLTPEEIEAFDATVEEILSEEAGSWKYPSQVGESDMMTEAELDAEWEAVKNRYQQLKDSPVWRLIEAEQTSPFQLQAHLLSDRIIISNEIKEATADHTLFSDEWWEAVKEVQRNIGQGWRRVEGELRIADPNRQAEPGDIVDKAMPAPLPMPRIKEMIEKFTNRYPGAPRISVLSDGMMGTLPIAGWFDSQTRRVYLNQRMMTSEIILAKTLWHESVGHGVVELLPKPAKDELVQLVKNNMTEEFAEYYENTPGYGASMLGPHYQNSIKSFMQHGYDALKNERMKSHPYKAFITEELSKPMYGDWLKSNQDARGDRWFEEMFEEIPYEPHQEFLRKFGNVNTTSATSKAKAQETYEEVRAIAEVYFMKVDNEGTSGNFKFSEYNKKFGEDLELHAETEASLEIVARISEYLGREDVDKGREYFTEESSKQFAEDPTFTDKIAFWFRKVFGRFMESLGWKQTALTPAEVKLGLLDMAKAWKRKDRAWRNYPKQVIYAEGDEQAALNRPAKPGEEKLGSELDFFGVSDMPLEDISHIESVREMRQTKLGERHLKILEPHEKFRNMGDVGVDQLEAMDAMYPSYNPNEKTMSGWWGRLGAQIIHKVTDPYRVVKSKVGDVEYMKARLSNREDGVMAVKLRHGGITVKREKVDGVTINEVKFDPKGRGLFEILRPLGGKMGNKDDYKSEIDRFVAWVAYKRADLLEKQMGEETLGIQRKHIDAAIDPVNGFDKGELRDATTGVTVSRKHLYAKMAKELAEWNKGIVDFGIDMGLFNAESASNWNTDWYLPFFRHFEEGIGKDVPKGTRNYKSLAGQTGIKQLKGSHRALDNPLDNLVRNAMHIISASLKNDSAVLTLEQASKIKDPISGEFLARRVRHPSESSLRVIKDGKDFHYEISDPMLFDSLGSMNVSNDFAGMGWALYAKNLFTRITTASPVFKVRNVLRDTMNAAAQSEVGYNVFKNAVGGYKELGRSEADMLVSGAYIQFGNIRSDDPNFSKKLLTKEMRSGFIGANPEAHDGYMNAVRKYTAMARGVWDRYQRFGDKLENANRAAIFRHHLDKGDSQLKAAFEARDLMDFTLHGGAKWVNLVTSLTPFANAMLQGKYKTGRALINNPIPVVVVSSAITAASIAEYFMYEDNEEWQRRQDWDKDMYWWINIPGTDTAFRMPKPHEFAIVANLAWRGLDMARKKDPVNGELFVSAVKSVLLREFDMTPIPQVVKPLIEVGMNKNFFFDRPIEPYRFKNMSAKEKRDLYTSETMITMSEAFDWAGVEISPMQLEHLVNGYFGWVGELGIGLSNMIVSKARDFPERPAQKFMDHPVLRKMFQASPIRNTKAGTAFYERLKDVEQAHNDLNLSKKLEDWDRYKEIYEEKKDLLKWKDFIKKKQRMLNEINKRIRIIRFDKYMGAEQKRERMDQLYLLRNQITDRIAESPALR